MTVKEVYSIRISKGDEEIKRYLEQFPSKKQNKALKTLLKYGVERLQEDYANDQAINKLEETIKNIQEKNEEKLEEIRKLIIQLQSANLKTNNETNSEPMDNDFFDSEKARKTMEEALSMFRG